MAKTAAKSLSSLPAVEAGFSAARQNDVAPMTETRTVNMRFIFISLSDFESSYQLSRTISQANRHQQDSLLIKGAEGVKTVSPEAFRLIFTMSDHAPQLASVDESAAELIADLQNRAGRQGPRPRWHCGDSESFEGTG